jgi:mandelamide amidase
LTVHRGYYFTDLDPEVERISNEALRKLQDRGVELVEAEVPDLRRLVRLTSGPIELHDVTVTLKKYLTDFGTGLTFDQVLEMASADVKADFNSFVTPSGKAFISDANYQAIDVL